MDPKSILSSHVSASQDRTQKLCLWVTLTLRFAWLPSHTRSSKSRWHVILGTVLHPSAMSRLWVLRHCGTLTPSPIYARRTGNSDHSDSVILSITLSEALSWDETQCSSQSLWDAASQLPSGLQAGWRLKYLYWMAVAGLCPKSTVTGVG